MDNSTEKSLSRSTFLKTAAGSAVAVSALGMPAILRGEQALAASLRVTTGGTLKVAVNELIQILDAYTSELAIWRSLKENIWDTLTYTDMDSSPVTYKPRLATSWKYVNPTTLELTLRTGVKFHDGSSFDADDVKFSMDRVLDPKLNSYAGAGLGPVAKTVVIDPTHVQIVMKRPFAGLVDGLGRVQIYSKHATQDTFTKHPIGTGPFTWGDFVPGSHMTLNKFDGYWDTGKPYLDQILYQLITVSSSQLAALESGEIDLVFQLSPLDAPKLKNNPNVVIIPNAVRSFGDIFYVNSHRPPLSNPIARQAVSYLIDRATYYKVFLNGYGYPNVSPFDKTNWAYYAKQGDASRFPYDLSMAKSLLAKAGYPNGKGFHLVFNLIEGFPEWLQGAQMIQAAITQLGGSMDIQTVTAPIWVNILEKTFAYDLSFDYSSRASSDPAATLSDPFQFGPDGVISRYHNSQMSQLVIEGAAKLTPAERKPYYNQFQTLWNQNLYGMVLGKRDILAASTKKVGGFVTNPEQFNNMRTTYLMK